DPQNRRYLHPFISCTACGPRMTVVRCLPYDRSNTTMDRFALCDQCADEYANPIDRRCHCQTICCPDCGPVLELRDSAGRRQDGDPIATAAEVISAGGIVAIKGIGGFHLACDAGLPRAVIQLRERKGRYAKPLAVMFPDLESLKEYAAVGEAEEALLTSKVRPIVLLSKLPKRELAAAVSPGLDKLGAMLPYSPLHHLLVRLIACPLVMTSGNISAQPIIAGNEEAIEKLGSIADVFLLHNREIVHRTDDSVASIQLGSPRLIRRARGFAPAAIVLPFQAQGTAIGAGGQLKSCFCIIRGNKAVLSQHLGDLFTVEAVDSFKSTLRNYFELFCVKPDVIAHDLHPEYASAAAVQEVVESMTARQDIFANLIRHGRSEHRQLPYSVVGVQHHHAHIAAVMAEHGLRGPVIGVAFDGSGYGLDGTLWGGEFISSTYQDFVRLAHLSAVPLAGGERAIRQTWRIALAYLREGSDDYLIEHFRKRLQGIAGAKALSLVERQLERGLNCPLSSGAGRLFDAAASVLDVCHETHYEGQAAIELETVARKDCTPPEQIASYAFSYGDRQSDEAAKVIRSDELIRALYRDYLQGVPPSLMARKFHKTVSDLIVKTCCQLSQNLAVTDICLSGGVFQNSILLEETVSALQQHGLRVFLPQLASVNDGGLALGQAVIALARSGLIAPQGEGI
ncbi:MAG TPA: carbamoyltransferase HypF, partial [Candidatus Obscuribacterales bacterium]